MYCTVSVPFLLSVTVTVQMISDGASDGVVPLSVSALLSLGGRHFFACGGAAFFLGAAAGLAPKSVNAFASL